MLKTLPGIDRPAICCFGPCQQGAYAGSRSQRGLHGRSAFPVCGHGVSAGSAVDRLPIRGLGLNIGSEDIKGNDQVKQAAQLLEAADLNYVGYVEGDGIYQGLADVVVCDGFAGNVALKSSEGVAKLVSTFMREEFGRNWLTKAAGVTALPVLKALRARLDPRRYNGGSFVGLRGIVVKSHGGADAYSFYNAVKEAAKTVGESVPSKIEARLHVALEQAEAV